MFYCDSIRCARVILLVYVWLQAAQTAKILTFVPFPMKSHHYIFQPVVQELAKRGHQVTYLTSVPMQDPVPSTLKQVFVPNSSGALKKALPGFVEFGQVSIPVMSRYFLRSIYAAMEATLGHPNVQEIVHSNDTYDLVLHEGIFCSEPVVALQHKFKVPGVTLITLSENTWTHEMSGLTNNPAYMVDFKSDLTDRMSFIQRMLNLYHLTSSLLVHYYYYQHHFQGLMDKYFNYTGWEDRPSIIQLMSDQALILVNSHHSIGYNFPRAPHVKEVGGLNLHQPRPLPKALKQILDNAQEGVVYFCLGSNINMTQDFSKEVVAAFIKVFSKLNKTVLWKWGGKNYPPVSSNIYMQDWFPQQDVLAHKNIKLYIMHGGQASSLEAVNFGIPVIGIPLFADQRRNVRRITSAGFGQVLDINNLTESSIAWAINEVLNNERYKQQAVRSQRIFHDRPLKPVEEAVYWIEYVLKHGNILQPASVHMPLYQLLLLDLMGAIAAAILLIVFITKKLFRSITIHVETGKSKKFKRK